MQDRAGTAAPLGRLGDPRWSEPLFVGFATACAVLTFGFVLAAAVLRSTAPLPLAFGAAFGIGVALICLERESAYTLIYPYELVLHNHRGPYKSILRGSVTSFRIEDSENEGVHIVAREIDGRKTRLAGSNRSGGPWYDDIVRPRRNAETTKAKLDNWLRDGRYR